MAIFATRSFDEIVTDAERARLWLDGLQPPVRTGETRLQEIEDRSRQLVTDLKQLSPEKVVAQHSTPETFYILGDGFAFGRIAENLSLLQSHEIPRGTLRDALAGPLVPKDESAETGSNDARNKFAELELAADLMAKGIRVVGFDDVRFSLGGREYHIQCKRPFSARGIDSNVEHAYRQLSKRMEDDQDRGFVALAVDKSLHLDNGFVVEASTDGLEIEQVIRSLHGRLLEHTHRPWERFIDTRVIGVIFIYKFLVRTRELNVLGTAYYLALQPLTSAADLQETERQRVLEVVNVLSEG